VTVSRVHQSDGDLHHVADTEQMQGPLDLTFHQEMLAVFPEPDGSRLWHASCSGSPKENKAMRDKVQNDALEQKQASSSPESSATLAAVGGYWKAYWKLALGMLLVVLLVVFVVQNANAIHVKFLVWEANMSQALVVFLALLSGVVIGVGFNRWQRWRSSHVQR
jgi:uncharacterized integral membrane protein